MSKTSLWTVVLILPALSCLGLTPSRAQDAAPPDVTVVRPTDNGFAELMQAGDASIEDVSTPAGKVIADAESPTATLTQKRAAAREPSFRNALALYRAAMVKPIKPPLPTKIDDGSLYDAFLRRIGRLLRIEQTVLLADGNVAAALDSLSDSLSLSDLPQRWNLIGLLNGIAIRSIAMGPVSRHFDELSVPDCDHVLSLVHSEMSAPDPAVAGIHAEGEAVAHQLVADINTYASSAGDINDLFAAISTPVDANGLTIPKIRAVLQMRTQDPKGWSAFLAAIARLTAARYDEMATRLIEYPSAVQRSPATVGGPVTDADRLAAKWSAMMPLPLEVQYKAMDKEVISRTCLQLLAVHAAILRWRWENNVVPDNLAVLKLGALATDPFTGGTLLYTRVDNRNYTLEAAGPPPRDDNGAVVAGGKRVPVTVPYPKPKQ